MLLKFCAILEAATGLALLIAPSLTGKLLLGAELIGVTIPVARMLGFAFLALGAACWQTPRCGMLTYSTAATLYLGCLGVRGYWAGPLLWPAVAGHAVLTLLLAREWLSDSRGKGGKTK